METVTTIGTKNRKGQVITDPRVMMNEAPRTASFYTGSEVIKEAVRRANVDVMVAYPITPQSEAAALFRRTLCRGLYRRLLPRGKRIRRHVAMRRFRLRRSPRLHDDRRTRHDARDGKLSQCGPELRLPIQMHRHLPRNHPLPPDPAGHDRDCLSDEHSACWSGTRRPPRTFMIGFSKGYMVSEEPDVHLPLALCCDGFFVTHTKDTVDLTPVDMCLPPYDPYRLPVPAWTWDVAGPHDARSVRH